MRLSLLPGPENDQKDLSRFGEEGRFGVVLQHNHEKRKTSFGKETRVSPCSPQIATQRNNHGHTRNQKKFLPRSVDPSKRSGARTVDDAGSWLKGSRNGE